MHTEGAANIFQSSFCSPGRWDLPPGKLGSPLGAGSSTYLWVQKPSVAVTAQSLGASQKVAVCGRAVELKKARQDFSGKLN